jgi:hypothetical protein
MKKFIINAIVLLFLSFPLVFPQGEAAIPFLTQSLSPAQNAMGTAGTSLPTDDPYGFLLNPAQLGYTSQTTNLSFMFYPSEIEWLGMNQLTLNSIAVNAGYNFKDLIGLPLSLGGGYTNPEFNYGTFIRTDTNGNVLGTFESKDYYTAWSFGAGIDYFVQFSAGVTFKDVTSILSDHPTAGEQGTGTAEVSAIDYGFLLNVPVTRLINDKLAFNFIQNIPALPYFNLAFGYAVSNIGDEVYYIDPSQSDPIPRTVRTGYGIAAGLNLQFDKNLINLFDFAFTVDADDILIERDAYGSEYQSGLGDINYGKNVIQIEGDEKVITRSGLQFSMLETLVLRNGHLNGRGFDMRTTDGIEIRAKGLLKMLSQFSGDTTVDFIADHFDLRYYNTNYFSDHMFETEMTGLALVVTGFSF